jgi:hypothetical protein
VRAIAVFVVLLLSVVVCAAAVPLVDRPETSYNEVDTPVNQAPPTAHSIRLVRPAKVAIPIPKRAVQVHWDIQVPVEKAPSSVQSFKHHSDSPQELLCTLLI